MIPIIAIVIAVSLAGLIAVVVRKRPECKQPPTWAELHAPIHYQHPRPARTAEEWLRLDRDELEMEMKIGAVIGEV